MRMDVDEPPENSKGKNRKYVLTISLLLCGFKSIVADRFFATQSPTRDDAEASKKAKPAVLIEPFVSFVLYSISSHHL